MSLEYKLSHFLVFLYFRALKRRVIGYRTSVGRDDHGNRMNRTYYVVLDYILTCHSHVIWTIIELHNRSKTSEKKSTVGSNTYHPNSLNSHI
jgi:hypothetical protein